MNTQAVTYNCGRNRPSSIFRTVSEFSDSLQISDLFQALTRRRLLETLLELPVPFQLLSNIYPHNGQMQDIAYRLPWSNKISTCKLPVTGSVIEDLKECTCFGDCLERFSVVQVQAGSGLEEMVPSSNPASQCSISGAEALWYLDEVERRNGSPWKERFSPCTLDASCFSSEGGFFSENDLTLPEDMIFADNLRFKSHLPSVHTMLQRLKIFTVSDPILHSSVMLSEDVIFRHCAPYNNGLDRDKVIDATETEAKVTEVFGKEAVLNEESLMLPMEVYMEYGQSQEASFSFAKLKDLLNLIPELIEEKNSCADLHKEVTCADKNKTELEVFQESSCTSDTFKEPKSPDASGLYTEMELDLPLSPCNHTQADLFLPSELLSAEQLSPVYKHYLLEDSEFEKMEKAVWMAEKHRECVVRFFLAEPQMCKPSVHVRSFSDHLMLLRVKREHVEENMDQSHLTDITAMLPKIFTDISVYTENIQIAKTETHQNETFSPLSIVQIDEMLFTVNADVFSALPPPDHPTVLHQSPSNHPQTAVSSQVDQEKTEKLFRMEQISSQAETTRKTDCKTTQIEQHNPMSFKHSTSKRCSEISRNYSETTCILGEQLNFSEVVEMSKSSLLKHKDIEVMPSVHKLPEQIDQKRERTTCKSSQLLCGSRGRHGNSSVVKSHESLDPLSSFMMLRTSQIRPVQTPQQSCPTSAEVSPTKHNVPILKENPVNRDAVNTIMATEMSRPCDDGPISRIIYVQATESQRDAYKELNVLAVPCLSRMHESGLSALNNRDFGSFSSELTRFLLKQHERRHHTLQAGADHVFNDIALLHVLVTLKELLLKCDLHTAVDYLAQVKSSCLDELTRKFEILQYLSRKKPEIDPKLLELQEQISTWMNSHINHNTKVLVLTANDVNTDVLPAVRQVLGNSVYVMVPEEGKSKMISRKVIDSLSSSRCVLLCRQHIGPDFPWQSFSLVFEIHCVDHSPFSTVCSEKNIKYISFFTTVPDIKDSNNTSYLDSIPFVLLVTDGLLKRSRVQRALETTYDMTLLERKHPPSTQRLGGDHYDVITVDENTAVFIQEVSELEIDKASNRVVMRLSALSLQFSRCWLILYCAENHRALLSRSIYINLILTHSSFVLFGNKPDKFDVKVLLVCDEEEMARYIYQISLHTLMTSQRDAVSWLDRDWLNVQPTEAERCLLQFPCINPLVSQLMLRRAPSLQWLLGASPDELQEMFPHILHKVIKLFSDITAQHKLKTAALESEIKASSQTNISAHLPPRPQTEARHSQQSAHFTVSLSGRHDRTPVGKSLCFREEDHISDPAWTLSQTSRTLFSHDSATVNVWQPQDVHLDADLMTDVISGRQVLGNSNGMCGFSCRRQDQIHWRSPENAAAQETEERKSQRPEEMHNVLPQCKRRRLLYERVPGRNDGQTRLRFF